MDIEIREMQMKEAMAVWKLGIKTFHSMEGIFMGKPKRAIVAVSEGVIVGGVTYSTYNYNGGRLGYVDYAFVDHRYHGQGIGSKLYTAAVEKLKELGCTQNFGLVRGDNPGSFRLFEKQGMQRCTLGEAKRLLGVSGFMRMLFTTTLSWGPAMDCYLSNAAKRRDETRQIFLYLVANLALLLLGIPSHKEQILQSLVAVAIVMITGVVLGASICLFQKNKYHFRLSIGGGYITAIISMIGGFFPLLGKWYPDQFDTSKKQKKELAVASIVEWAGILALYVVMKEWLPDNTYAGFVAYYCSAITVFRMLPTFPFNEYGGRRVYEYCKWQYAVLWMVSAGVLYVI